MGQTVDIENRNEDFREIHDLIERLEFGIRSICVMYDEHSSDTQSHENIFHHKANIYYRLSSARISYKTLLKEIGEGERWLLESSKGNPREFDKFVMGNPFFDRIERDVSGHFDNLIFQLASAFDYMAHVVCYICQRNKSKTQYWMKLARSARGEGNEIAQLAIKETIDAIDRAFVGKLYDYRSRLSHHERDKHQFEALVAQNPLAFRVTIKPSLLAFRHFSSIHEDDEALKQCTLAYMSSWLIRTSIKKLDLLLDALVPEIVKNSSVRQNMNTPKGGKSFIMMVYDKDTNTAQLTSQHMWRRYKAGHSR
ncbi:MAG TPA: hypothetical protein PK760_00070 [Flavobacteriales bacterium]|nr:hypothetical protein [Flavobacteriales bacterium]